MARLRTILLILVASGAGGGLWWYFGAPNDLRFEKIDVSRLSDFAELRQLPQQDHYVARISFSSTADLRQMMLDEATYDGTDISARPCTCDEKEKRRHGDWCSVALGPFPFDRFGEIQHHHNVAPQRSSRTSSQESRVVYHFYIPVQQWGISESPYDLAKKPVDFCAQIRRFGYLKPTRTSNLMFIPKTALAKAIARARVP
jgi:hypothetical protein